MSRKINFSGAKSRRKSHYTTRQADNVFARINDAFKSITPNSHVQFVENNLLRHGIVESVWGGIDKRLVVRDDAEKLHYLRDMTEVTIFSDNLGGYVPVPAYRGY